MNSFGTDEYGNKNGFKTICQKCGKEAKIKRILHYDEHKMITKVTIDMKCDCGNLFGATVYSE